MIFYNLYGRSVGAGGARGARGARGASGAGGFLDVLKHFYDFLQLIWEVCRSWGCQEGQA